MTKRGSSCINVKKIAWLFSPPILREIKRFIVSKEDEHPYLEYSPAGWNTVLSHTENIGWNSTYAVSVETERFSSFCTNLEGTGPIGFMHDNQNVSEMCVSFHNRNITYAFVLALVAHKKETVTVLDWGGSLGHNYLIGKALLPYVTIDFHCKEVPLMAEAGKKLNPDVHFSIDESCLLRTYDLVIMNGVLQYYDNWVNTLCRIAPAVNEYLFLGHLPLVYESPGFVAIQRHYGTEMLHEQFNRKVMLEVIEGMGFSLVREFLTGLRPYIKNAPEQCELFSWLFKRNIK
jgi:putative methyltransferase (TIGR04325 family)